MKKLFIFICCLLSIPLFSAVKYYSLQEQIQESQLIIVGKVHSKTCFTAGKANFIHTLYKIEVLQTLSGFSGKDTLLVDFAGGECNGKKSIVSDIPALEVDETSVFIFSELTKPVLSPLVGGFQGRYISYFDNQTQNILVKDSNGLPYKNGRGNTWHFRDFVNYLEAEIPIVMSSPKPVNLPLTSSLASLIKDKSELPYNNRNLQPRSIICEPADAAPPIELPSPVSGEQIIPVPSSSLSVQADDRYHYYPGGQTWCTDDNMVWNRTPDDYAFNRVDQIQMSYWNRYAGLFKVYTTASGTWAYDDGTNDIAGFVSDATLYAQTGYHWDGALGITCIRFDMWDDIGEADICINPAHNWSLDPYSTVNDPAVWPLHQTMLHELGHAWGADHEFGTLSVMAYMPKEYRAMRRLYKDDTQFFRMLFGGDFGRTRKSILVAGYHETSTENLWLPSNVSASVEQGGTIVLTNFYLENPGNVTATAIVDFYLTPVIASWNNAVYLGTSNFGSMAGNTRSYVPLANVPVPMTIPTGTYYLAMMVSTPGDEVWQDNDSWVYTSTEVIPAPPSGVWLGGISTNWFEPMNWSDHVVPGASTDVTIPNGTSYRPYISTGTAQCNNLTVQPGAIFYIPNYALYVNGSFVNSGTVNVGSVGYSAAMHIYGNVDLNAASYLNYLNINSTVRVQGSWNEHVESNNRITVGGNLQFFGSSDSNLIFQEENNRLYNVSVSKESGYSVYFSATSTVAPHILGSLTINPGNQLYIHSSQDLYLTGSIICPTTSYIEALAGTIKLVGSTHEIQIDNSSSFLNSLQINSTGIVTLHTNLNLRGNLIITSGTFNVNAHTINLWGNWQNDAGPTHFNELAGRVILNGLEDQEISTEEFYTLELAKPAGRWIVRTGQNVTAQSYDWTQGEYIIAGGNFIANDLADDSILGTITLESGNIYYHQDSSGSIDLNASLTILSGTMYIYGGLSSCWFAAAQNASITMSGGTLDVIDRGIYINSTGYTLTENITGGTIRTRGSFVIGRAGFIPQNSIVELYGTTDAYVSTAAGSSIWSLAINKAARVGEASRSNTVTATGYLTLKGDFGLVSGRFIAPEQINIDGNWYNFVGADAFVEGTGAVVFQGNGHQYCASEYFNTLVISKIGGAFRLDGTTVMCNSYEWNEGAVDILSGNLIILDIANPNGIFGTYYVNTGGKIIMYQDAASLTDLNATLNMLGGEFHVSGGSGASWWSYGGNTTINMLSGLIDFHEIPISIGNWNTLSATVISGTIATGGSFSCARSDFNPAGLTLKLYGSADATLDIASGSTLCNLLINKTDTRDLPASFQNDRQGNRTELTRSNTVTANSNLILTGNFEMLYGTFNAPLNLALNGNFSTVATTSNFVHNSGTVNFLGNQASTLNGSNTFYNLQLNKSFTGVCALLTYDGINTTVQNNLILLDGNMQLGATNTCNIAGSLTISSGAGLDLGSNTVQLGGGFHDFNTTITETDGLNAILSTLVINGSAHQNFVSDGSSITLNNLTIDKPANEFRPANSLVILGNLDLQRGVWSYYSTGLSHTIGGNLTVGENAFWYDHSGLVTLNGASDQLLTINASLTNAWFNDIRINKVAASRSIEASRHGGMPAVILNTNIRQLNVPELTIDNGALDLNGYAWETNGNVTVNANSALLLSAGSTLKLNGNLTVANLGTLIAIGSESLPTRISHYESSYYQTEFQSGSNIGAYCAIFEYINTNGLYFMTGSTIAPDLSFNYCTFRNGIAGGYLLRIDNTQTINISGAVFPANSWSGAGNVRKTNASGQVNLSSYTGSFAGSAFESDPNNLINWAGEIPTIPDLSITQIAFSNASPYIGDYVSVSVTVRNNTDVAVASPFWVDLYLTLSSAPTTHQMGTMYQQITALAANTSRTLTFDNVIYSGVAHQTIYAQVDGDELITETNETNNVAGPADFTWNDLPAVADLAFTLNATTGIPELTWTYPIPVDRFEIRYDQIPGGTFTALADTTSTFIYNPVTDIPHRFYRVYAIRDLIRTNASLPLRHPERVFRP